MALTPAERQQRRRAKLAALRPPIQRADDLAAPMPGMATRQTRQEAWDEATETLQRLIEDHRTWRALNSVPVGSLRILDLPALAAQALTLAMIQFPDEFGTDWYFPDDEPLPKEGTGLDPRTLREQLFSGDPAMPDPDNFPRSDEQDAAGQAWWSRIPLDARSTWLRTVHSTDPLDVWYALRHLLKTAGVQGTE